MYISLAVLLAVLTAAIKQRNSRVFQEEKRWTYKEAFIQSLPCNDWAGDFDWQCLCVWILSERNWKAVSLGVFVCVWVKVCWCCDDDLNPDRQGGCMVCPQKSWISVSNWGEGEGGVPSSGDTLVGLFNPTASLLFAFFCTSLKHFGAKYWCKTSVHYTWKYSSTMPSVRLRAS